MADNQTLKMVPGQIFYFIGPHPGPRKDRMELSFMDDIFVTHETVNLSKDLAIKSVGPHSDLTM